MVRRWLVPMLVQLTRIAGNRPEIAMLLLSRRIIRFTAYTLLLVPVILPILSSACLLHRVLLCTSVLQRHVSKVRIVFVVCLLRLVARRSV